MTLLDMANFVCGKVTQTEAEDVLPFPSDTHFPVSTF